MAPSTLGGPWDPQKSDLVLNIFLIVFWTRFGCLLGSHLGLLGTKIGSKFGPGRLLRCFFVKKRILKKSRKTNGFSMFLLSNMAPKTLQDRPKTPPRRSWRGTFSMFKIVLDFDPFWVRFWVPLGAPLGSKRGPKIDQIRVPDQGRPQVEPQEAPRGSKRPQEGPKRPQEAPRGPPKGPTESQESPQEAPREPQEAPRGSRKPPR